MWVDAIKKFERTFKQNHNRRERWNEQYSKFKERDNQKVKTHFSCFFVWVVVVADVVLFDLLKIGLSWAAQ